ncbi:site-specific integrase [uncultured Tissierella sp.]|uniref:site-specific integrase n=1 Tax=uncultured Tissierella sp. TaxID=448160 RepID=UPI002803B913|nr:site-specific integrase [uncultured Tissierella sp.]MDU5081983.1 site-specific integrase [Bacillota bacterium]
MATIEKRGNSYRVSVSDGYDSAGKKILRRKSFKRPDDMTDKKWEKEINRLALKFETEVLRGLHIDSSSTLEEYSDRWLKEYGEAQLQPKTLESYKSELNGKILPALGHIKLDKLTPVRILSFLNNLMEDGIRKDGRPGGYSDRTIKYQWQILSSMLQQAVYWQILPDNPCKRVKVPKNINNKKEFSNAKIESFNEDQVTTLLEIIKDEALKYQVAFNIALFCGLRNGEILGLTWNDIDFENRTLSVNKSRSYIVGQGMITKVPKNNSSIRVVGIPDMLIRLLKEYKLWQNGEKATCGTLWTLEWEKEPWLLTQWNGEGMSYNRLTKWLLEVIRRYNDGILNDEAISDEDRNKYLLPELSFHKLRHTSATLLISNNTDIRTVSARLGHAQTSTTMNIYVHGLKSADDKATDMLNNLFDKKNENININKNA